MGLYCFPEVARYSSWGRVLQSPSATTQKAVYFYLFVCFVHDIVKAPTWKSFPSKGNNRGKKDGDRPVQQKDVIKSGGALLSGQVQIAEDLLQQMCLEAEGFWRKTLA